MTYLTFSTTHCNRLEELMRQDTTNELKIALKINQEKYTIKFKISSVVLAQPSVSKAGSLCQWTAETKTTQPHTGVHRLHQLHIEPQTPYWAFRVALRTVCCKECQRAFTSALLSQSIDCTMVCFLGKKRLRLLLHCACVSWWLLWEIVQLCILQTSTS